MNNTKLFITMLLVLAVAMSALAGCSRRNDADNTTPEPSMTPAAQEDVIGVINYVGDESIAVSIYETDSDLSNLASLDLSSLTPTDSTRYIPIDDHTEYYFAMGTVMTPAKKDDLAVGDLIAAVTGDNGNLQVTRLSTDDAAAGNSSNSGDNASGGGSDGESSNSAGNSGNGGGSGSSSESGSNNAGGGSSDTPAP